MVQSCDDRALAATALVAAVGLFLVGGCSSPGDDALATCQDRQETAQVELCRRPRGDVPALSGLSTHEEVRAAIVEGRVEGMCGAGTGEAPTWAVCAVFHDEAVVVAAAIGPAGAHGTIAEAPGLSFPLAQAGDEVTTIHGAQRAVTLQVVAPDGEVVGSVGVNPS